MSSVVLSGAWQAIGTVADPHTFQDQGLGPLSPPTLGHTLDHLLPGEDYELRVSCQNSVGGSVCGGGGEDYLALGLV